MNAQVPCDDRGGDGGADACAGQPRLQGEEILEEPQHPKPYTLHPTPYTLHPTPQTLTPEPQAT